MVSSSGKIKSKMRKFVCEKFINVDFNGKLKFKSRLGDAIKRGDISHDDALSISLELMFGIKNYDYNYKNVCDELDDLILKVNEYNTCENENIKNSILFFHNYDFECEVLSEYIGNLSSKSRGNVGEYKPKINKSGDIKKYFDHLSREDLCNILDMNSDLNFDKEKILKKQIADEFLKYDFDFSKLDNASSEDIKKYLKSLAKQSSEISSFEMREIKREKEKEFRKKQAQIRIRENKRLIHQNHFILARNKNYSKSTPDGGVLQIKDNSEIRLLETSEELEAKTHSQKNREQNEIIQKIRLFNNKKLQSMVTLKSQYFKIYQYVCSKNIRDNNVKRFKYYFENFDKIEDAINLINQIKQKEYLLNDFISQLNNGEYVSNSCRKSLIFKFKGIYNTVKIVNNYPYFFKDKIVDEFSNLDDFIKYYTDLLNYNSDGKNSIREINENFIQSKIGENEQFFSEIDDLNKKKAIVCDEDNVKVVAGAGAGKTFIIEKKINYLIENEGIDPKKILCLCFTKRNVDDLNQRVNNGSKKYKVNVSTFHEFCRQVDKVCEGGKTSNRYLLQDTIREYVRDIVGDSKKLSLLCEYFSYYSMPILKFDKFESLEEYENYGESLNLISLKNRLYEYNDDYETFEGKKVKSLGELRIANYLFMHDIEYEYERYYPYNYYAEMIEKQFLYTANYFCLNQIGKYSNKEIICNFIDWEKDRITYQPDFYIPEKDLYLEHFGVDENMEASFLTGEAKRKYEMQMNSKRVFHELYGTKLIETYSFYMPQDRLLTELEELLRKNGVTIGQINYEKVIEAIANNNRVKEFDKFVKLVESFINIYESKNLDKANFNEFRKHNTSSDHYNKNRQELFFNIVEDIYNRYYEENLHGNLSPNHEIINALKLIRDGKFKGNYDYIFIDEYQDINPVRCQLIQVLQRNSKSKIFAVGDDWQSIYGFAGSNVNLFIQFEQYFENPEVIKIKENRRNPQKLIEISSEFILKNPSQECKELEYYQKDSDTNSTPIKIVKYKKDDRRLKILKLDSVLQDIIKNSFKENPKIYILGRNNDDIEDYVGNRLFVTKEYNKKIKKIIYSRKRDLEITFMTVHQSKGLQADEVIVINLEDKYGGFPNKIDDDPILSFIKDKNEEECEFPEERRLFYVALTRTKNNAYLMAPVNFTSIFVKQLSDGGIPVSNLDFSMDKFNLYDDTDLFNRIDYRDTNIPCPKCHKGVIRIVLNNCNKNGRKTKYVRCSKYCGYNGGPYPANFEDYEYVKKCPKCERGVLVKQGNILRCCLNYHEGCTATEELHLDEDDLEFDYE